jgi:hypothetical protein
VTGLEQLHATYHTGPEDETHRAAPRLPEDDRRVPGALSGRGSLPRVPLRLSLAGWLPLSGVRFGSRLGGDDAAAVAVSELPPPGLGNRRHGPAQDQDSIRLWFWAAYLMTTATPGVSALQLYRQLGLNRYETAWMMLHKLRRAMVAPELSQLTGAVEVDETYVGGADAGRRGGRDSLGAAEIVIVAVEVRG